MNEFLISEAKKAEEAIAGIALIAPASILQIEIDASYFSDPLLAKLIETAKTQSDSSRMVALAMRIGFKSHQIADLVAKAGSPVSIRDYGQDLVRMRQAQNLATLAKRVWSDIDSNPKLEPAELITWIESEITKIRCGCGNAPLVDVSEVVDEVLGSYEQQLISGSGEGIKTGLRCIDDRTGGFFAGQLWQIAARTYMGKTALALELAARVAATHSVLFVSLEMSRQELVDRLVSNAAQIPIDKFGRGDLSKTEIEIARRYENKVKKLKLKFTTAFAETVASIRAKIRLMQSITGVGLVVIDNLQLIKPADHRAPRHERIKQCTVDLKTAARELQVPILLLSQLNADAEGNEPNDTHYAGSKETLPDLDVSILMHRESKDHPDVELICTKNRRGGLPFRTKLIFDGQFQSFTEPKSEFEEWTG